MNQNLHLKAKTTIPLEETTGINLHELKFGQGVIYMTPKGQATKEKIDQMDLIKIKHIHALKDTIKRQPKEWEKNPSKSYLIEDFYVEYMKYFYNSIIKRLPNQKQAKDLNSHFSK